jgi:hypothetical protein
MVNDKEKCLPISSAPARIQQAAVSRCIVHAKAARRGGEMIAAGKRGHGAESLL